MGSSTIKNTHRFVALDGDGKVQAATRAPDPRHNHPVLRQQFTALLDVLNRSECHLTRCEHQGVPAQVEGDHPRPGVAFNIHPDQDLHDHHPSAVGVLMTPPKCSLFAKEKHPSQCPIKDEARRHGCGRTARRRELLQLIWHRQAQQLGQFWIW